MGHASVSDGKSNVKSAHIDAVTEVQMSSLLTCRQPSRCKLTVSYRSACATPLNLSRMGRKAVSVVTAVSILVCGSAELAAATQPKKDQAAQVVGVSPRESAVRPPPDLLLDPGQLELQTEMFEYAEFWYNLTYVRNATPPGRTADPPILNATPGFACRETSVSVTDNIDEFPLFASVPANIFLGSIIKGDTLLTNTYGVFSGPRNSAKITISVPYKTNPIGTETMDPISHPNYLDALRRILAGGIKVPAATGFLIERMYSQDQLKFAMKANVSGKSFDVAAQFSIKTSEKTQYALLSVNQLFFRLYLDRPDYAADYWAKDLKPEEIAIIKKEMTVSNPPLYVSAIDYGRKAYILFETSNSSLDIQSTLSAGYNGVVKGSGEVSLELKKALESMTAKGFIIGGSSTLGNNTIGELFGGKSDDGFDALGSVKEWIQKGSEPSEDNPPAATGYEFALLLDGSKVAARTTTAYKETDCKVGVCPSGFYWGKKNYATWFEINVQPNPKISPAAGLIGDVIDIQDGHFYTYTWPSCDRIFWRNVSLKCVANERSDFTPRDSPPGIWVWNDDPGHHVHEIGSDYNCFDWNADTTHVSSRRINSDGAPPVILDTTVTGPMVEGFAKDPKSYWRWRELPAD
jgi:hypothetical protein